METEARAWDGLGRDVRYAVRRLRTRPGFAAAAILTLALAMGATTAVWGVVDAVLLRPLPYSEPDRLVWVAEWQAERPQGMSVAWPNYVDWRERSGSFAGLAGYVTGTTTVVGGPQPVRAAFAGVSVDFWNVFPVAPVRGRLTTPEDHRRGAEPVAVVRRSFWENELARGDLAGLRLEVLGRSVRVVGVLPEEFDYPAGTEIWTPTELEEWGDSRSAHSLSVVGRLADGASPERADEELDRITAAVVEGAEGDSEYLAQGALVVPLHERVAGGARTSLLLVLGAAALVLLTACVNLASTMLARGEARRRELAIRTSLGASRKRVVRQLFVEGLTLAAAGSVAGVALARWLLELLRAAAPAAVPRLHEVSLDARVLAVAGALTVVTAVLFGLLPALRLSRAGPVPALREGARGSGAAGGPVWRLLVGTEVALALLLLVGSGLLLRSFHRVAGQEWGFEAADVSVARVSLGRVRHEDPAAHARWFRALLADLEARPGVESAALVSSTPLGGFVPNGRVELDGDLEKTGDAWYVLASGSYFGTFDIPLLRGRTFDERDTPDAPHVAVVSRSFAERYWPGQEAVGRSVTGGGMDDFYQSRRFATVIGVVEDVRYRDPTRDAYPTVYFPYTQRPFRLFQGGAEVAVEAASGDAAALAPVLRSAVASHDPDVPVRVRSMESVLSASVAERRFLLSVLGGFALVAVVLAATGIYGVVSWSVARRTREMGIRLALGAAPGTVRAMVVGQALAMVAGGLLVGTAAALLGAGALASLLYEVEPRDPVTFVAVVVVLLLTAVAASWLPALRSTRVDPALTMRAE